MRLYQGILHMKFLNSEQSDIRVSYMADNLSEDLYER